MRTGARTRPARGDSAMRDDASPVLAQRGGTVRTSTLNRLVAFVTTRDPESNDRRRHA
jgi:hypothetical protein